MPSLSQSPVLQALGYAIANSLWQMAMVWIVYVLLNSIFKFRSEIKFRIAVAAQVAGFSWFLVTMQFYYRQCSQALELAQSVYQQSGDQETYVVATEKGSLLSYLIKAEQLLPYLSVAYLLLLVFLIVRWFRAYRYTQLVRLNGLHKINIDWKLFVSRVAGQLGIKQHVRIFLSELVQSPVTIGFLKPVILVPIASINHLTPQQMEAVILHELAHIKRHDYLLNILLSVIELGLFFNPFTRLITKSVSKERENSCDDWVLQYQYNPAMYAEALLRIAVLQKTPAMAMYAVKTKGELLSRVQRMVHQKDNRFNYRHQLIALLLMTGILASLAWFDPSSLKAQEGKSMEAQQAVVLEPLAVKVNNPLFNPIFFLNDPLKEEVKQTVARVNERHVNSNKLKKEERTLNREFNLPRVLAPVAIENLNDIEKRIASVTRDNRKTMMQAASRLKLAQNAAFFFDTLQFKANINLNNLQVFAQGDPLWANLQVEEEMQQLQKAQKGLEDALKKGTISRDLAKNQMTEINEAMKKLKEVRGTDFYSFAPGAGSNDFVFRNWLVEDEQKERTAAGEKRRNNQTEIRTSNVKIKRAVADSLRHKLLAKATIKTPHVADVPGMVTMAEGNPLIVLDKKNFGYLKDMPAIAYQTTTNIPLFRNREVQTYSYGYSESEDECEKANRNERSRRVIISTNPQVRGRSNTPPKPKAQKKTVTGNCTVTSIAGQKEKDADAIMVEVEIQ